MTLTKEQCFNIKGIGMILIMIHNFVDNLLGIECNEMYYSQNATDFFLNSICSSSSIVLSFFSFAGWIGVPLFFFMSGYSLTKKYGKQKIEWFPYIKRHAIKLWKLLLPVYLLYVLISHYCFGQEYDVRGIIAVATLTGNFFADTFFEPGVYWFFGVILQLYILFLLMRHFETRWLINILLLFLLMYFYVLYLDDKYISVYFRYTFRGWIVPFILGMIFARKEFSLSKKRYLVFSLISSVALVFCLVVKALAPFVEIMIIIFVISLVQLKSYRLISFIGIISSSIFVIHPFVRMILMNTSYLADSYSNNPFVVTSLYVLITIPLSWCHYYALRSYNNRADN